MTSDSVNLLREVIVDCNFPEADIRLYTTFFPLDKPISEASTIQGIGRVLLGSYPLIKNTNVKERTARALAGFEPEELSGLPLESSSPLGFILGLNPLMFFKVVIAAVSGESAPCAILDAAEWNPVHTRTIAETLQLVNATHFWNRIKGENEITRSAVISRIRAQFRHLYSDTFDQSDPVFQNDAERMACTAPVCTQAFLHDRLLALRAIEHRRASSSHSTVNGIPNGKTVWEKIPGNWYLSSIQSRTSPDQSLLLDLHNIQNLPPKQRAFLYASVIASAEEDETPQHSAKAQTPWKVSKKANYAPTLSRTRLPGQGATHCPSREIAMELTEACQKDISQAGAAAILFTITAAVAPDKLHPGSIEVLENSTIIRTATKLVNIPVPTDFDLHRPTSLAFTSVTTHEIGSIVLARLKEASAEQLQRDADGWLQKNPRFRFTFKGLCKTLRYNFPLWMDLPAVYYDLGLREPQESMPGWRHYINYSLQDFGPPIAQFITENFDPGFILPDQACQESCGSAFTPEPSQIRTLFSLLASWLRGPLPSDKAAQIAVSNVIAAGCRLAETLLTFSRGRDAFTPLPQAALKSSTARKCQPDIRHEKQHPRVIYYPSALLAFLKASNGCLRQIAESTGSMPSPNQIGYAYWFVPGNCDVYNVDFESKTLPYRLLVSSAFTQHLQTGNFALLHPHGMRNLSNLILRRDRVLPEDAVLAIHDHFHNRCHSLLEFDCLQTPIMEAEREKAADHLCERLGLGEFVTNER